MSTSAERTDLIDSLARHRGFLLETADGLTEEQARTASTVSELRIASILKHVAEISHHNGHAGIIREAIDGKRMMG